jgi:hypothetical protein
MNNILVIRQALLFFIYTAFQVLFLKNIEIAYTAFCFLYINFILLLPIQINRVLLLFLGFTLGITVDAFYDTLGIHAFACVLIAYLRPIVIALLSSNEELYEIKVKEVGLNWFLRYIFLMTFIHHLFLFFLQQFNFNLFFDTIIKVIASTVFTCFGLILVQYIFYTFSLSNVRR